ncbi:MAG: FAD-dependent oxidoreductase [Thermofilaceae archaeon]
MSGICSFPEPPYRWRLYEPITIGRCWIKNRIAMAPMGLVGMVNNDGSINRRIVDYYVERAKGGIGLIITGLTRVENEIEKLTLDGRHVLPILNSAKYIPSHSELTEEVHHWGARIFVQLTAGTGRVLATLALLSGITPVSASEVPAYWLPTIKTRALTREEVKKLVKAFGDAAEYAALAGYDGVELHGHEGYLLDQFTSSAWNLRTDEYGGSLENRLRLPVEILDEIKSRVGKGFPVVYRFGVKHFIKGLNNPGLPGEDFKEAGRDVEEGLEMAKLLEKAGFDALHVDAGCYDSWYMAHPPEYLPHGCLVEFAAIVKRQVNIPVISVGRLDDPLIAEKVLREGKADMVAIGRGVLADPEWPNKVRAGKFDEIRPCIGCHECLYRIIELARPLSCAVNPRTGRERELELKPAEKRKKVVVVGGGVAGMELARVAKLRGHEVVLFEQEKELGGHLIEAGAIDFKSDIRRLKAWYDKQLQKLQVDVRLGVRADLKTVLNENPDVIVVATGSKCWVPPIPGVDKPFVTNAIEVLRGRREPREEVVIIGAGLIGVELSIWLAQKGKKVSIVEMLPAPSLSVSHANKLYLMAMLKYLKIPVHLGAKVEKIEDGRVVATTPSGTFEITCDSVILCTGLAPVRELYEALTKEHPDVYVIGDALSPRKIRDAVWDAYYLGMSI